MSGLFAKLLIANRGEIACRVIATARRLGIATVAVYSDADADALHVGLADEAFRIGPAPSSESYLRGEAILEVARRAGAGAVHPGYGFLSENADFAEACGRAGVVFVGPPPAAIRAMGDKAAAKELMRLAGLPLVPGYHGAARDDATLRAQAGRIGYPVLIKPTAGGGGKGMRVVADDAAFVSELAAARREACAAFGDDRVLIERYLARPRHIEAQIFADRFGDVAHLFERDCSIQRRHQKIIEEAPAPGISEALRAAILSAAVACARAVGYVGAGTVEFIVEGDAAYFIEMNTRLQVEHPVTEMITGVDLVEWQLRVAAGERLPLAQAELAPRGHAIEARIYAEDPRRGFLPSIGRITHLRAPLSGAGIRVDTGVREGDAISPYYDPMIAKLIAHGADRAEALGRLNAALDQYEIAGVRANPPLLRAIARHPAFASALIDTDFISRHAEHLLGAEPPAPLVALAAAAFALLEAPPASGWPDPWSAGDSWRLNLESWRHLLLRGAAGDVPLKARLAGDELGLVHDGTTARAIARRAGNLVRLRINDESHSATILRDGARVTVILRGQTHEFESLDRLAASGADEAGAGLIVAPIPGRIASVLAVPGALVRRGEALVVLEAMKMELTLSAGADGAVASVRCAPGDMVAEGHELVVIVPPAAG